MTAVNGTATGAVAAYVAQREEGATAADVAQALGIAEATARTLLARLADAGRLHRSARGRYVAVERVEGDVTPDAEDATPALDPPDEAPANATADLTDATTKEPTDMSIFTRRNPSDEELQAAEQRAAELRAQRATAEQDEARRQQQRAREFDERLVAGFDPAQRQAEEEAATERLRVALAAVPGVREALDLLALQAVQEAQRRDAINAADRLGVPAPAGSDAQRWPTTLAQGASAAIVTLLGELLTERHKAALAEGQQRRQAYVESGR